MCAAVELARFLCARGVVSPRRRQRMPLEMELIAYSETLRRRSRMASLFECVFCYIWELFYIWRAFPDSSSPHRVWQRWIIWTSPMFTKSDRSEVHILFRNSFVDRHTTLQYFNNGWDTAAVRWAACCGNKETSVSVSSSLNRVLSL